MQEFLRAVLAGEGHYCIVGIRGGDRNPVIQSFFPSLEETDKAIETFLVDRRDVYFALATFKDPSHPKPRSHGNTAFFRSLWADVDCGEDKAAQNKGYATKEDAIIALEEFLAATGLPEPAIVDSGGGIHIYWRLDKDMTSEEWQPLSIGLRDLCLQHKFLIDAQCTTDMSRILRVPNTYNFKQNPLRQVRLLAPPDDVHKYEEVKALLPQVEIKKPERKREPSALTKALMGNKTTKFETIIRKSAKGEGCAQIINIYRNQDSIPYDLWRAGLSIAEHCEDRDVAIHKMSKKHPDYDPHQTEEKASDTRGEGKGPFLCQTFDNYNPGVCADCKFRGKIKSPIVLGQDILESKAEVVEVVEVQEETKEEVVTTYDIPKIPEPFFRGEKGGIYRRDKDDDKILVYAHDLFVIQRISDEEVGESLWMRLHLPQDGVINFTVPLSQISGPDTMRTELSKRGVITWAWKDLQAYILRAAGELQVQKKAELAHHQFGWTSRGTFVVGDIELDKGKKRYVPPTATTSDMVGWYHTKGHIDEWKRAFNMYAVEGMENRAFAALSAFGAPLLKIATDHSGILLNLVNRDSGTGKTTILKMINSVWGHPKNPLRSPDDTKNSLVLRMGILNNLPLTVDEQTNIKPEELSNFLYGITQGRGKDRMNANSNTLRVNKQSWQTIGISSSNSSHYDKLHLLKDLPKGEVFRCVEYTVEKSSLISTEDGRVMFDEILMENYGHAWYPYMTAVQAHTEEVKALVKKYVNEFNERLQLDSSYRFYSALGGINLAGGHVAKELGLHNYNLTRIFDFYANQIEEIRSTTVSSGRDAESFLSHFILKYMAAHTLIIDGACDVRVGNISKQTPKDDLFIRIEPDTKRVFITVKAFRKECSDGGSNYKDTIKELESKGLLVHKEKKNMTKGTLVAAPSVDVLVFDADKLGIEIPDTGEQENVVRSD